MSVETPAQFIETVGVSSVAKATGRTDGAVKVWKHRNKFPREAWLELNKTYPALSLDELKRLEENGKAAAKRREEAA